MLSAYGVPPREWHLYDVDHRPKYDAAREPDHRKYELVPMLRGEHSRKTARKDGGFGNDTFKRERKGYGFNIHEDRT